MYDRTVLSRIIILYFIRVLILENTISPLDLLGQPTYMTMLGQDFHFLIKLFVWIERACNDEYKLVSRILKIPQQKAVLLKNKKTKKKNQKTSD